ncbi:MAG: RNA 2',3'-cyclic phosphodiesterase [Candidatus Wildermuthbacteria bacterium]|nr:RNA 2',3'-cyclic phosphodiesterase [Candidatus Wildermuthbacteria bacterium]
MKNLKPSRRVYVGIKVTDEIAEACVKLQSDMADLPAKFIPPEDIHVTLLAPWDMVSQSFVEERLRKALRGMKRFTLKFERLAYGPSKMHPRLAWIQCTPSSETNALKKSLLAAFKTKESVPFVPHMTIARFTAKDEEKLTHRPIEKPLAWSMSVESVELFSSPHKGGAGYKVLSSFPIPFDGLTPR